jgi:hypothetical protein
MVNSLTRKYLGIAEETMKIAPAFLVKDEINYPELWELAYQNGGVGEGLIHLSAGGENKNIRYKQVKTVKTSWEQTVPAHFELYRGFLELDASHTHMMLLSESCVPLVSIRQIADVIKPDTTYVTGMKRYGDRAALQRIPDKAPWKKPLFPKSAAAPSLVNTWTFAEQFALISRKHIEILVQHEEWCKQQVQNTYADNEMLLCSFLHWYAQGNRLDSRGRKAAGPHGLHSINYLYLSRIYGTAHPLWLNDEDLFFSQLQNAERKSGGKYWVARKFCKEESGELTRIYDLLLNKNNAS